ncbi:hypothetical protein NDU88_004272 [Pleurodeles waltl]|uniref:Uncharacterized protein n=1 Tax=Pleurodeles waltl TaxID=8319 RepID=A0AAV7V0R6_PLEWA|nr:hypothetical protein NDU88_004272 [Pleurodeles waltl]
MTLFAWWGAAVHSGVLQCTLRVVHDYPLEKGHRVHPFSRYQKRRFLAGVWDHKERCGTRGALDHREISTTLSWVIRQGASLRPGHWGLAPGHASPRPATPANPGWNDARGRWCPTASLPKPVPPECEQMRGTKEPARVALEWKITQTAAHPPQLPSQHRVNPAMSAQPRALDGDFTENQGLRGARLGSHAPRIDASIARGKRICFCRSAAHTLIKSHLSGLLWAFPDPAGRQSETPAVPCLVGALPSFVYQTVGGRVQSGVYIGYRVRPASAECLIGNIYRTTHLNPKCTPVPDAHQYQMHTSTEAP